MTQSCHRTYTLDITQNQKMLQQKWGYVPFLLDAEYIQCQADNSNPPDIVYIKMRPLIMLC